MLKEKMQDALNEQINAELYSSYLYYAMANYFESVSLGGFAGWMRTQALEEMTHVYKFAAYINERGGRVTLKAIDGPRNEWDGPLAVFEEVYKHECHVSELINKLVDLARELSDHATDNMLQWFVEEQVEEEATADEVLQKLKLGKDAPGALYLIDQELATRKFVTPPWLAGKI